MASFLVRATGLGGATCDSWSGTIVSAAGVFVDVEEAAGVFSAEDAASFLVGATGLDSATCDSWSGTIGSAAGGLVDFEAAAGGLALLMTFFNNCFSGQHNLSPT